MKIDKFFLIGITMILGGLDHIFSLIPHSKGSKSYCVEPGCMYIGIILLIIGILIITYKIFKWYKYRQMEKK